MYSQTSARVLTCNTVQEGLSDTLQYLSQAEEDYKALQMFQPLFDIYYYRSVIYHNLGMEAERDRMASLLALYEEKYKQLVAIPKNKELQVIWDVVSDIGATLSLRK